MKKFLFLSFFALLGLIGCSSDNSGELQTPSTTFSLYATQLIEESRVTIDSNLELLNWELNDALKLTSQGGVNTTVYSQTSGKSDVLFRGEGTCRNAESDDYYAIYPSSQTLTTDGIARFDYTRQDGSAQKAICLIGRAKEAPSEHIVMDFKPINALLYVKVEGLTTGESLQEVTFSGVDNDDIYIQQAYNLVNDYTSEQSAKSITIAQPKLDSQNGFYLALAGGQQLSTGYTLKLTTNKGCTLAAFGRKSFLAGESVSVTVTLNPYTITLGAKTTYSYYAGINGVTASNVDLANSMEGGSVENSGSKLFLGSAYASSYSQIQRAIIDYVGFRIQKGSTIVAIYTSEDSNSVTWNTSKDANGKETAGSFYLNTNALQFSYADWGTYTVSAFVKTKQNNNLESAPQTSDTFYVTGLPYYASFNDSNTATINYFSTLGWVGNEKCKLGKSDRGYHLTLEGVSRLSSDSERGYAATPAYRIPNKTRVTFTAHTYSTGEMKSKLGAVNESVNYNQWSSETTIDGYMGLGMEEISSGVISLTSEKPRLLIQTTQLAKGSYSYFNNIHIRYQ